MNLWHALILLGVALVGDIETDRFKLGFRLIGLNRAGLPDSEQNLAIYDQGPLSRADRPSGSIGR